MFLPNVRKATFSISSKMATSGTLQRMSAKTLSEKIKAEEQLSETTVAIVDVRDDGVVTR